jgi:hypothetical protein
MTLTDIKLNSLEQEFQFKSVRAKNQAILKLDVAGMSTNQIAKELCIPVQTVLALIKTDIYLLEKERYNAEVKSQPTTSGPPRERLKSLADLSLDVLERILRTDDFNDPKLRKLKVEVAFDVLDRSGYQPVQQHEIGGAGDFADIVTKAYSQRKAKMAMQQLAEDAELVLENETAKELAADGKDAAGSPAISASRQQINGQVVSPAPASQDSPPLNSLPQAGAI